MAMHLVRLVIIIFLQFRVAAFLSATSIPLYPRVLKFRHPAWMWFGKCVVEFSFT